MIALALLTLLQADTVRYQVSFPNAAHHEAEISMTVPVRGRDTIEVWMSRSSPGRYAIHEFAKNVYSASAEDAAGRPLTIVRDDPYRWLVVAKGATNVTFNYTLFADRAGGTYTGIDRTHAHMNIPATFAWVRGDEHTPIAIRFDVPAGSNWKPATQLVPTADEFEFTAPDMQYFMDSPTELSNYALRTWTITGPGGRVDTIRITMHYQGTDAELDNYTAMAKKVVAEQVAVFGETARYDDGTYTFLADYLPWASGDGMEHRNSTIISSSSSLARNTMGLIGTLSHEFFHSWNMERIRSRMIEPFDFTRADPSDALWFGEGFTQYYGQLVLHRAGLVDQDRYLRTLGGIISSVVNSPARNYGSPIYMSLHAPFVDAATAIDPTNFTNTFLSYYTWGAGVALGLDLTLREKFPGKTLDGFMRQMWLRYGADGKYTVLRPYTVADLERELGEYSGDVAWAHDFFKRYIRSGGVMDYAALLQPAGFEVRVADPDGAFLGQVRLDYGADGATLVTGTHVGSPLYRAGVDRGDRIISIGGTPLTSRDAWNAVRAAHHPGDEVEIVFSSRGAEHAGKVKFGADPRLQVVAVENSGKSLSASQRALRDSWLGTKAH